MTNRMKRLLVLTLATGLLAAPAQAGVTPWAGASTDMATACAGQVLEQPFLAWRDSGSYVLAPNGGLEDGAVGWRLTGAAGVAAGNEPFFVRAATDRRSLALGAGSSATSPAVCVGLTYPYLRFFASGPAYGILRVEVLYVDVWDVRRSDRIAVLTGGSGWQLGRRIAFAPSAMAARSPDGAAPMAFRFTSLSGTWRVDDLYVDPYKAG